MHTEDPRIIRDLHRRAGEVKLDLVGPDEIDPQNDTKGSVAAVVQFRTRDQEHR